MTPDLEAALKFSDEYGPFGVITEALHTLAFEVRSQSAALANLREENEKLTNEVESHHEEMTQTCGYKRLLDAREAFEKMRGERDQAAKERDGLKADIEAWGDDTMLEQTKRERDSEKARADEAEQDARQMYAVFKDLREIVKNAERHIGIEQIVAVFAPLRWEGDKPPKWLDPLVKVEAALKVERERFAAIRNAIQFVRLQVKSKMTANIDAALGCLLDDAMWAEHLRDGEGGGR